MEVIRISLILIAVLADKTEEGIMKSIRVSFIYKTLLVIVKIFDKDGDDNYSIKYYHKPEAYERVKSFWTTVHDISETEIGIQAVIKARNYFRRILNILCNE
jgi:hypothetical protein